MLSNNLLWLMSLSFNYFPSSAHTSFPTNVNLSVKSAQKWGTASNIFDILPQCLGLNACCAAVEILFTTVTVCIWWRQREFQHTFTTRSKAFLKNTQRATGTRKDDSRAQLAVLLFFSKTLDHFTPDPKTHNSDWQLPSCGGGTDLEAGNVCFPADL